MTRMRCTLFISFLLFGLALCAAQTMTDQISIGASIRLHSDVLDEERAIFVSLPTGYSQSEERYPVLYLFDADLHFRHTSGLVEFLAWAQRIPPMIIVGVRNSDRARDFTLKTYAGLRTSGGGERFLQFLETELIPFVDRSYRTLPYRMLAGWSLCGQYALFVLFRQSALFNSYIAISPGEPTTEPKDYFLWTHMENNVRLGRAVDVKLHFSVGDLEAREQILYVAHLAEILKQKAPKELSWTYDRMAGDDHNSLVHKTIARGLELIFDGWNPPDEMARDGVEALKRHYRKWGYDIVPEGSINAIGYRLMALNEVNQAIEVLKSNCEQHARSANTYDSLAEAYERSGGMDLALKNYETAARIAQETNDPRLQTFRSNYERFRKAFEESNRTK